MGRASMTLSGGHHPRVPLLLLLQAAVVAMLSLLQATTAPAIATSTASAAVEYDEYVSLEQVPVGYAPADLESEEAVAQLHRAWMRKHGKFYSGAAEQARRERVWRDNLAGIVQHNARRAAGYKLGLNRFADLTEPEFHAQLSTFSNSLSADRRQIDTPPSPTPAPDPAPPSPPSPPSQPPPPVPAAVNWVRAGAVTPIKDQKHCGSCWAFAAVGAIESAAYIATGGPLETLSEQELIDCDDDQPYEDHCAGGNVDVAFAYASRTGVARDADWPYRVRPAVRPRAGARATRRAHRRARGRAGARRGGAGGRCGAAAGGRGLRRGVLGFHAVRGRGVPGLRLVRSTRAGPS